MTTFDLCFLLKMKIWTKDDLNVTNLSMGNCFSKLVAGVLEQIIEVAIIFLLKQEKQGKH